MNIRKVKYSSRQLLSAMLALSAMSWACNKSDESPTQGPGHAWVVSGKVFVVGSVDPLAGVVITCSGVTATSGPDGSYELRGVPEGTQNITAGKQGFESYSHSIEVRSDLKYYIYVRQGTAILSGTVSHAFDGPIEGARVAFRNFVDYTDILGRFQFNNVPRITDTLTVAHPTYIGSTIPLSIDGPEKQVVMVLKRDTVIDSRLVMDSYVDQVFPSTSWGYASQLLLGTAGTDSLGQFRLNRRNILLNFTFPEILRNDSVALIDASLQLCSDRSYPRAMIETYTIESSWNATATFNKQPNVGSLIYSDSVGDGSGARYWQVLGFNGFKPLFARWKALTPIYGVMVQGGLVEPRTFYSSRSAKNTPRLWFKVRY